MTVAMGSALDKIVTILIFTAAAISGVFVGFGWSLFQTQQYQYDLLCIAFTTPIGIATGWVIWSRSRQFSTLLAAQALLGGIFLGILVASLLRALEAGAATTAGATGLAWFAGACAVINPR